MWKGLDSDPGPNLVPDPSRGANVMWSGSKYNVFGTATPPYLFNVHHSGAEFAVPVEEGQSGLQVSSLTDRQQRLILRVVSLHDPRHTHIHL